MQIGHITGRSTSGLRSARTPFRPKRLDWEEWADTSAEERCDRSGPLPCDRGSVIRCEDRLRPSVNCPGFGGDAASFSLTAGLSEKLRGSPVRSTVSLVSALSSPYVALSRFTTTVGGGSTAADAMRIALLRPLRAVIHPHTFRFGTEMFAHLEKND